MRYPRSTLAAQTVLPLLALFCLIGGCGVGEPTTTPQFQIQGVGVNGGVVTGGDIQLAIPPGALAQPTVVSILPQLAPFPIAAPDACTYTYLGPLWCCGPVGHPLAVDGVITVKYDDSLVPPALTESDLVLLTWDESAMVLRPNFAATHDTVANTFTLTDYDELGHIAVGVRDCGAVIGAIVFAGLGGVPAVADDIVAPQGDAPQDGLYLHSVQPGAPPPVLLPVSFPPSEFVASPDGSRVLYEDFTGQSIEGEMSFFLTLMSVPTDTGIPVQVAGEPAEELTFTGDPFWGWLRNAGGQYAYFEQFLTASNNNTLVIDDANQYAYSRVLGDGSVPGMALHGVDANTGFTTDLRQSPDGSHVLIRYEDFSGQFGNSFSELIDVIESDSQVVLSSGLIPVGGGLFTPRFSPDGNSVYLVSEDRTRVEQYPLDWDGITPPTILFELGLEEFFEELLDFVISADGGHFAAVVKRDIAIEELTFQFDDFIYLGDFAGPGGSGQILDIYNMGLEFNYDEVYLHPSGSPLYVQRAFPTEVVPFELLPDAEAFPLIVEHPALPVPDLAAVDISREDGRLLMTLGNILDKPADGSTRAEPPSGLCVSDPLGMTVMHVDTLLGLTVTNARWLQSVRTTPGMRRSEIR